MGLQGEVVEGAQAAGEWSWDARVEAVTEEIESVLDSITADWWPTSERDRLLLLESALQFSLSRVVSAVQALPALDPPH